MMKQQLFQRGLIAILLLQVGNIAAGPFDGYGGQKAAEFKRRINELNQVITTGGDTTAQYIGLHSLLTGIYNDVFAEDDYATPGDRKGRNFVGGWGQLKNLTISGKPEATPLLARLYGDGQGDKGWDRRSKQDVLNILDELRRFFDSASGVSNVGMTAVFLPAPIAPAPVAPTPATVTPPAAPATPTPTPSTVEAEVSTLRQKVAMLETSNRNAKSKLNELKGKLIDLNNDIDSAMAILVTP